MARTRHQEGRVEESGKAPKKWKGFYYTYDEAGKRHHRSADLGPKQGRTKTEAKEELRKIIERETGIKRMSSGEDTVGWYWLNRFAPFRDWNEVSRNCIEGIFRRHVLPTIGPMKVTAVDKYQVQLLLKRQEKYSKSQAKAIRSHLGAMFDELIDEGIVGRNPTRKVSLPTVLRNKKTTERYLSSSEILRLLAELGERERLICRMFIVLGFRPGELFALKWDDVDPLGGRIRIDESYGRGTWKPTKTEDSTSWIWVPAELMARIMRWRQEQQALASPLALATGLIFPGAPSHGVVNPMNCHNFLYRFVRPAAIRAGIVLPRPKGLPKGTLWANPKTAVTFQSFRRTCATHGQKAGTIKDVQSLLRHTSAATTMKYYIKELPASVRGAVEGLDASLFGAVSGGVLLQ